MPPPRGPPTSRSRQLCRPNLSQRRPRTGSSSLTYCRPPSAQPKHVTPLGRLSQSPTAKVKRSSPGEHARSSARTRGKTLAAGSTRIRAATDQGLRPRLRSASAATDTCSCERSEEHTSELQSLRHLVCRLLLEKK